VHSDTAKALFLFWFILVFVAFSVLTCEASAQGPSRALVVEDQPGVWFPLEDARELVREHLDYPRIHILEERLVLSERQVALLTSAVGEGRDVEAGLRQALESAWQATEAAESARASASAWYWHPGLWFAVGAVLVGGLVAAVAVGS
jgi:hypothetical protein